MFRLKNSADADDVQITELSQALQEAIEQATEHVEALFDKEWGTLIQRSKRKSHDQLPIFSLFWVLRTNSLQKQLRKKRNWHTSELPISPTSF